jgi:hypothetical protein
MGVMADPGERKISGDASPGGLRVPHPWLREPLDAPIRAKHLVATATAVDIELLQDVKAAVLMRLSDEAYYEALEIDRAVEYLGRSRYRRDPGVTYKVELRE